MAVIRAQDAARSERGAGGGLAEAEETWGNCAPGRRVGAPFNPSDARAVSLARDGDRRVGQRRELVGIAPLAQRKGGAVGAAVQRASRGGIQGGYGGAVRQGTGSGGALAAIPADPRAGLLSLSDEHEGSFGAACRPGIRRHGRL